MTLIADDLSKLYAIDLSHRTRHRYPSKPELLACRDRHPGRCDADLGIPLPLGVVGHEGSTVIVVLNGLRLLLVPQQWKAKLATGLPVGTAKIPATA